MGLVRVLVDVDSCCVPADGAARGLRRRLGAVDVGDMERAKGGSRGGGGRSGGRGGATAARPHVEAGHTVASDSAGVGDGHGVHGGEHGVCRSTPPICPAPVIADERRDGEAPVSLEHRVEGAVRGGSPAAVPARVRGGWGAVDGAGGRDARGGGEEDAETEEEREGGEHLTVRGARRGQEDAGAPGTLETGLFSPYGASIFDYVKKTKIDIFFY